MKSFEIVLMNKISASTPTPSVDFAIEPESVDLVPIRTIDDLDSFVDLKIKRRLKSNSKFIDNVGALKNLISEGHLVINVVAPGYNQHKSFVDLIVSTALTESPKKDSSTLEDKKIDSAIRDDKKNSSIVSDINVDPADETLGHRIDAAFFGTDFFNPKDSESCLYPYVSDYMKNPVRPNPEADSERDFERGRADAGLSYYRDGETGIFENSLVGRDKSYHSLEYSSPAINLHEMKAEDQKRGALQQFPGIYFDERKSHFRIDPDNFDAVMYVANEGVGGPELDAKLNFNKMIKDGIGDGLDLFRAKWAAFTELICAIQDSPKFDIFSSGGFDSEGKPIKHPRSSVSQKYISKALSDQQISKYMETFLSSFGINDRDAVNGLTNAAVSDMKKSPVSATPAESSGNEEQERFQVPKAQIQETPFESLTSRTEKEKRIARDFLKSLPVDKRNEPITQKQIADFIVAQGRPRDYALAVYALLRNSATKSTILESINAVAKSNSFNKIANNNYVGSLVSDLSSKYKVEEMNSVGKISALLEREFGKSACDRRSEVFIKIAKLTNCFSATENGFVKKSELQRIKKTNVYDFFSKLIKNKNVASSGYDIGELTAEYLLDRLVAYLRRVAFDGIKSSETKSVGIDRVGARSREIYIRKTPENLSALNIGSTQDLDEKVSSGSELTISDSKSMTKEKSAVSAFELLDDTYSPVEDWSQATIISFTLSSKLSGAYSSNSVISFSDNTIPVSGVGKDMYSAIYGQNKAQEMLDIHRQNGVSLSPSILPTWAPEPFDYRRSSASGDIREIGHPNNAFNVKQTLNKWLELRGKISRRLEYDSKNAMSLERAIKYADQNITEMQKVLYNYSAHRIASSVDNPQGLKDDSLALTRGGDSRFEFVSEVIRRCKRVGLDIGDYRKFVSDDKSIGVLKHLFSDEDFKKFLSCRESVEKEFESKKNILIIRNAIPVEEGKSNGLFTREKKKEGYEGPLVSFDQNFAKKISELYQKMSGSSGVSKGFKSSILIISTEPIPSLSNSGKNAGSFSLPVSPEIFYINCDRISSGEIEELVMYYSEEIQRKEAAPLIENYRKYRSLSSSGTQITKELLSSNGVDMYSAKKYVAVMKFTVPTLFIRNIQRSLSSLDFQNIDNFISQKVKFFFDEYLKRSEDLKFKENVSVSDIIEENKISIDKDIDDVTNANVSSFGQAKVPSFTIDDYLVKKGTEWSDHVSSLAERNTRIKEIYTEINLLGRCLASKQYPVTIRKDKDNTVSVSFASIGGQNKGDIVWANSTEKIVNFNVDSVLLSFARELGVPSGDTVFKRLGGSNFKVVGADLDATTRELFNKAEVELKRLKSDYPALLLLEGSPGTGKSIFPEVLASVLGCKFIASSLDKIIYDAESKFVGQATNNCVKFLEECKGTENTILLLDEIDKFFADGHGGDLSPEKKQVQGLLQAAWESVTDLAVYQKNNFHIVAATNFLDRLKQNAEAFVSRFKGKGPFKVELPGDVKSCKEMLSEDVLWNNMLNGKFSSSELRSLAKKLIALYEKKKESGNPVDAQQFEFVKSLVVKYDKDFFTRTFLTPASSENSWRKKNGLGEVQGVSPEEDFLEGWIQMRQMMRGLKEDVQISVNKGGSVIEENMNPLNVISEVLSSKMSYPASSVTGTSYPKTTMRELTRWFEAFFERHSDYSAGRNGVPFNWKTLLAAVKAMHFRGNITPSNLKSFVEIKDEGNQELISQISENSGKEEINGLSVVYSTCYNPSSSLSLPVSFWETKEQFEKREKAKADHIQTEIGDRDSQISHLKEILSTVISDQSLSKLSQMFAFFSDTKSYSSKLEKQNKNVSSVLGSAISLITNTKKTFEYIQKTLNENKVVDAFYSFSQLYNFWKRLPSTELDDMAKLFVSMGFPTYIGEDFKALKSLIQDPSLSSKVDIGKSIIDSVGGASSWDRSMKKNLKIVSDMNRSPDFSQFFGAIKPIQEVITHLPVPEDKAEGLSSGSSLPKLPNIDNSEFEKMMKPYGQEDGDVENPFASKEDAKSPRQESQTQQQPPTKPVADETEVVKSVDPKKTKPSKAKAFDGVNMFGEASADNYFFRIAQEVLQNNQIPQTSPSVAGSVPVASVESREDKAFDKNSDPTFTYINETLPKMAVYLQAQKKSVCEKERFPYDNGSFMGAPVIRG